MQRGPSSHHTRHIYWKARTLRCKTMIFVGSIREVSVMWAWVPCASMTLATSPVSLQQVKSCVVKTVVFFAWFWSLYCVIKTPSTCILQPQATPSVCIAHAVCSSFKADNVTQVLTCTDWFWKCVKHVCSCHGSVVCVCFSKCKCWVPRAQANGNMDVK